MAELDSLILNARARELAPRAGLTISERVEQAPEGFYRRLGAHRGEDIALDALIQDHRLPHWAVDL
jgi:hypothetical protein